MNMLTRLLQARHIQWYIGLLAIGVASLFTFWIYRGIGGSHHEVLDPDFHGPLGYGLWKLHRFSYYPQEQLTADRGPLYPLMIAGALAATNGWWPYSVQLVQCLLFGVLCVLVFWLTQSLWNRSLALIVSTLCALDPFLIWYTSRVLVEMLLLLLFTAMIASVVYLLQRPSFWRACLLGVIIGLATLTKSIFGPYLALTPLLLLLTAGRRLGVHAVTIFAAGIVVVAPWMIRNGALTGVYSTTVGREGFALHQGNDFVQDFWRAPYSVSRLYPLSIARIKAEDPALPETLDALHFEQARDASRWRNAAAKLKGSPGFLLKKIAYNSILFWTLGDTPGKSLAIACLQLPLVAAFCVFLLRCIRHASNEVVVSAALTAWYFASHLPVLAVARYSVVLVPTMLALSVGLFAASAKRRDSRVWRRDVNLLATASPEV